MTLELISPPRTTLVPAVDMEAVEPAPAPAPDDARPPGGGARTITAFIVGVPFLALVAGIVGFWGRGVHLRDLVLAVALYALTGHGVTIGFHRLLAHKSFAARRPVRLVLLAFGSMAYEGAPIGWVANHRRHHVVADTVEDPHSPQHHGTGVGGTLKGLWHAHVGWLFTYRGAEQRRYAADLLADRDVVIINALFPLWCVVSFALPFGLGWALGGTIGSAFSALFWAGLVRVALLHHATWSVNSLCHMFGRRPFATRDQSSNVGLLAIVSMGESWHNGHHAFPRSARHGLLRGQWDTSALVIRGLERIRLVDEVNWPPPESIRSRTTDEAHRRRGSRADGPGVQV